MAFRLAIAEGADFIEPDLVATKDGVLVVRHENEISQTTNVALMPEFESRLTTRQIQGHGGQRLVHRRLHARRTEDHPLPRAAAEAAAGERQVQQPGIHPDLQEVIDLAKAESARLKRPIGTYPEMKHASYFAGIGLPLEGRLADILKTNDLDSATAPVFIQCFDVLPLKTIMGCAGPRASS